MNERCILCGAAVPEGWMICPDCAQKQEEAQAISEASQTEESNTEQSDENEIPEVI